MTIMLGSINVLPSINNLWNTWDGSNDGANTNLFTAGNIKGHDIVAVSDNEAILFYKDDNEVTNKGRVVVFDVASKIMSNPNTDIALSILNPVGMNVVRMTDTRFLCLAEDTANALLETSLIGKSGKTLTELDNADTGIPTYSPLYHNSLARLNDTQGVFIGRNGVDTNDGTLGIIDITGDVITVGTLVDLNDNITDYPAICRLTDTSFMCTTVRKVYYCTVSGTTITVEGSTNIIAAGTAQAETMLERIDDTTALLAYEKTQVDVNTFSWSGSAVSRGTPELAIFGGTTIFGATGNSTDLGDRQVMFSGRQDVESPRHGASVVCEVDVSNNITVGTEVQLSTVEADHNTIDATPSGNYVFYAYQDETTLPIQQVGTRVLVK